MRRKPSFGPTDIVAKKPQPLCVEKDEKKGGKKRNDRAHPLIMQNCRCIIHGGGGDCVKRDGGGGGGFFMLRL
jgi:hypothetical protein